MSSTQHPFRREVIRVRQRLARLAVGWPAVACRRTVAALLPLAALAVAPSVFLPANAAAAPTVSHLPDLVITKITISELPGVPPYIAVDEQTRAPGFVVKVITKNIGTAAVGQSVTDLQLQEGTKTLWGKQETVGKLTAGMYRTSTFTVDNLTADPGMLHAVATADYPKQIRELSEVNNTRTARPIPVVPRDWNVDTFRTTVNELGGATITTQTATGFYYRLSRFDESKKWFVYKAYGRVNDKGDIVGAGCEGHASAHDSKQPWPGGDSELVVRGDLSAYSAGVDTQSEPELPVKVTCQGGGTLTLPFGWTSLVTWVGAHSFPSMSPSDMTLDGEGKATTPLGPAKYTWKFVARVSGV